MNPSQQSLAQKITTLRSLKGAPASIILALAICGPLTNKKLQQATDYSDKPITDGLALLELYGMVSNIGRKRGWTLSDGMRQLPLFPTALLGSDPVMLEGARSETFRSTPPTTTTHILNNSNGEKVVVSNIPPESRKNSEQTPQPVDNSVDKYPDEAEIDKLLRQAGIGRNSPKLREIHATRPTLPYIRAHVNYFFWWQKERKQRPNNEPIDGWKKYSQGMLITRILDNDPAPAEFCRRCGPRQTCVCDIVSR